jgi:WD40 repeat protein
MKLKLLFIFLIGSLSFTNAQNSLDSLKLVSPEGQTSIIESAVFNSEGNLVVSASADNSVLVWDFYSGKIILNWQAHLEIVNSAVFNSNSTQILTASSDGMVKLWSAKTGELFKSYNLHISGAYSANFSPDEKTISVASYDGVVLLLNSESGEIEKKLIGHSDRVYHAIFSKDGKQIISSSRDKTVKIWDVYTGELMQTFSGHSDWVRMAIFGDDNNVISCSRDKTILNWSLGSGKIIYKIDAHKEDVNYISICSEKNYLASCSKDKTIKLWKLNSGNLIQEFQGHSFGVNSVLFSPDSKKIISASDDGSIRVWDLEQGRSTQILKGNSVKMSNSSFSKGHNVLSILTDKSIVRWDAQNLLFCQSYIGHNSFINSVDMSDNENLLTSSLDNTIKVWDRAGKILHDFEGHSDFPLGACFNSNSSKFLSFSIDNTAKIWDAKTIDLNAELIGHKDLIQSAYFFGNDRFILTESADSSVIIWDTTGKVLKKIMSNDGLINSSEIDGNIKKLALATNGGTINIWSIDNYELCHQFKLQNVSVNAIAFGRDSRYLFSGDNKGRIIVWNLSNGQKKIIFDAHTSSIQKIIMSKNGLFFLTQSSDNHLKIWNTATFELIFDINHFDNDIYSIDLHEKDSLLITTTSKNRALIWSTINGALVYERIQLENNNWLVKLPNSPYYMCSKDASKMLHYVTPSLKVIGFEQLDPLYNRPDIVLDSIGKYFGGADAELVANYRDSWEKRIDRLGLDKEKLGKGEIAVPDAEIVDAEKIEYENKEGNLSISVKANDPKYPLRRCNVYVNEVPLYGSAGISIAHLKKQQWDTTISVPLSIGENKIQVSVMNELGLENFKYPTYVNYILKKEEGIVAKTHYIGIGVNEFQQNEYNLTYCVKDVNDLAEAFGGENAVTKIFTDSEVTRNQILQLKQYLQDSTTVNDKVIISCSSHGLLDDSLNFYLATHDVDFDNPKEKGLKYEELENLLDGIPARQKLLLLDACNSGENDKTEMLKKELEQDKTTMDTATYLATRGVIIQLEEENKNNFKKMNELFVNVRNNTGSVIISAAGGQESALEAIEVNGKKIENGAFTYSVLEYLKANEGKTDALTVNKLKQYVENRVEEITNGKQKPTSRQETMEVDWGVR